MKYQILVTLLAQFGLCSTNPVTIHEISTSNNCKFAPKEIVSTCEAHKGSKLPFSYASISKLQGCILVTDSTKAEECMQSIHQGKIYNIEKSQIESSPDNIEENNTLKTIASATKATAIISGINLVATIAGVAAFIILK